LALVFKLNSAHPHSSLCHIHLSKKRKKMSTKKKLALFLKVSTADPQNRQPLSYLPAKKIKRKKLKMNITIKKMMGKMLKKYFKLEGAQFPYFAAVLSICIYIIQSIPS